MEDGNHTKRVVGLSYKTDEGLPRVVLKGAGRLADDVIRYGREINGPPVVEDRELMESLYRLPVDAEISSDLFEVVAALLVHIYAIDEKTRQENT